MCKACHSCIRILMMIFNVIFVLIGLGLFALGLYCYLMTFFKNMGSEGTTMVILFYAVMGIGTFTLIIGACGCCGAYHESPCLLGTYFVLLLIIFAVEIAGGVFCFIYNEKVQNTIGMAFKKGVEELSNKVEEKEHWMDEAQRALKCCGEKHAIDYLPKVILPDSCCDDKCGTLSVALITGYTRKGCTKAWREWLDSQWITFAAILLGIAIIEFLGLVFSMCLCCTSRNVQYDIVETRA